MAEPVLRDRPVLGTRCHVYNRADLVHHGLPDGMDPDTPPVAVNYRVMWRKDKSQFAEVGRDGWQSTTDSLRWCLGVNTRGDDPHARIAIAVDMHQ